MNTRVFLVDDRELIRVGLRAIMEAAGDLVVVGEAATTAETLARIPSAGPDVAVIDVRLGDESGIELCRHLHREYPKVRCLLLSTFRYQRAVAAAMEAGAAGYMLKHSSRHEVLAAIRRVAAGGRVFDQDQPHGSGGSKAAGNGDPSSRLDLISEQERRILMLITEGRTNRQIAAELFLAESTVKNYVSRLLAKLGMVRRSEAAGFAARFAETGLFDPLVSSRS